jgi:hypothetical protein
MGEARGKRQRWAELQAALDSGKRAQIQPLVTEITRMFVDQGKLIEAGWIVLRIMAAPDDWSEEMLDEMRNAYFAGAQHLFASMMSVMEEGAEPTEADMRRVSAINDELNAFIKAYKLKRVRPAGRG